jgi:hypothetical protein
MDVASVKSTPVAPTPAPKRTPDAASSEASKPREAVAQKTPEAKPPAPFVNSQGHVTGRRLNVTA